MEKIAYVMVGVPGSGKSTWMKQTIARHTEMGKRVGVFSLDQCRLDLARTDNYSEAFKYAIENPKAFDEHVNVAWHRTISVNTEFNEELSLVQNDVVIVDNTNLTKKSRARWVNDLRAKKFHIVGVQVMVPLVIALERQHTRGDKFVPESVVRDMYMRQQELMLGSEVDQLINVKGF